MERRQALVTVMQGATLRRALLVALIVGAALNLINQPDALLGTADVHWPKLLLTFCVPFLVASYGAYAALRNQHE